MTGPHYDPAEEVLRVAEQCCPILAGEPSMVQGAALCELVARHIAGHVIVGNPAETAAVRRSILAAFVETVEQLIVIADEDVIQPELKRRGM